MKNIQIFVLSFLMVAFSCTKESNGNLPSGIQDVNIPLIIKDPGSQQNIDFVDANNFSGKFIADIYFKDGPKPEKADVVMIKNGVNSSVKSLQTNLTTFPTTISLNKSIIETAFGQAMKLADSYTIGMDMYYNGIKYEAFPLTGIPYGTNIPNLTLSSTFVKYDVVCPFNIDNFSGSFEVLKDDWEDYAVGAVITVSKISATSISFNYNCSSPNPIIMTINVNTGALSGNKIQYCSYNLPPVLKFFGDVVEGNMSFLDFCSKTINVKIAHTDELDRNFGEGVIVLKKK
ncbi:MAG: hypothetical protein WBP08_14865 [Saprospiraceae bacterium]|nr:hypothetical protein [Saprospiraceae bacterium]